MTTPAYSAAAAAPDLDGRARRTTAPHQRGALASRRVVRADHPPSLVQRAAVRAVGPGYRRLASSKPRRGRRRLRRTAAQRCLWPPGRVPPSGPGARCKSARDNSSTAVRPTIARRSVPRRRRRRVGLEPESSSTAIPHRATRRWKPTSSAYRSPRALVDALPVVDRRVASASAGDRPGRDGIATLVGWRRRGARRSSPTTRSSRRFARDGRARRRLYARSGGEPARRLRRRLVDVWAAFARALRVGSPASPAPYDVMGSPRWACTLLERRRRRARRLARSLASGLIGRPPW